MEWISYNKSMKGSHHWKTPCVLCNQWITKNEDMYMIYIPNEIREKYKNEINYKLKSNNLIVHKEEWDEFTLGLSDEEIIEKLLNHKKPKRKAFSPEVLEKGENFKKACEDFGYYKCVVSKDKRFIKMKKRKTSFTLIYDMAYNKITYEYNSTRGLFDELFIGSFLAKIENKFHEYCGSEKRNDYSIEKIIKKANEDVDKLMGKI